MRRNLFLLSELVRRDLSVRYAGSFGGAAWALLNPLILCGLYSLVFSLIVRIAPPADFRGTYTEFLLAGLLPWLGLQDALVRSASAVTDQAHLVKKMSFPVGILVVASLLSALVLQAAGLCVFAILSGGFGAGEIHLLPLAVGFAFQALLLAGPAFALAAASVLFRDLAQLIGPLLTVVFYLTPILYPEVRRSAGPGLGAGCQSRSADVVGLLPGRPSRHRGAPRGPDPRLGRRFRRASISGASILRAEPKGLRRRPLAR